MVFVANGLVKPEAPGGRPCVWAATGRSGGVSSAPYASLNLAGYVGDQPTSVVRNRGMVARGLGLGDGAITVMDSVHGAELATVSEPGVIPGVDAMLTRTPGLAIVALGADCVPVGLIGADGRTIAVAHCGWRGLVADVISVTVDAMRQHGTDVRLAVLGPSVCGQCYPVPPARAHEVRDATSTVVAQAAVVVTPDGQPGIDVRSGVRARLIELGVPVHAITIAGGCTVEDPTLFSYRRDGVTGRQGIAVAILDPAE
jgi:polyphenol oxidase